MTTAARPSFLDMYEELGYCLIPGLVDASVIARGRAAIERTITPGTSKEIVHIWGTRLQTIIPEVFIPELDEVAWQPRVLDVARAMVGGPIRLSETPIVVVTFQGKVCGSVRAKNWIGHLDGVPAEPFDRVGRRRASLWIAFADIEPDGGAMTVVPGSHKHVHHRVATDPAWVKYRQQCNEYTAENNIEGMEWNPTEITCKAGDGFFYYGHSIHSASDNSLAQPRIVAIYNYVSATSKPGPEDAYAKGFSKKHIESMSRRMREIVGV